MAQKKQGLSRRKGTKSESVGTPTPLGSFISQTSHTKRKTYRVKLPHPFVQVIWRDAMGKTAWSTVDDLDFEAPLIVSRGWLVKETEETIFLAGDIGYDDPSEFNSIMLIPLGMVVEKKVLKL